MTELFADSGYFIAMLNPSDQHHSVARAATDAIEHPLVTTVWVLMEVADGLCSPAYRRVAHRFLESTLMDPKITLIADFHPWLRQGLDLYGRRPDKAWSLTDCISFEVMTERGIVEALAGDRHFTQAGFQALLLPSNP